MRWRSCSITSARRVWSRRRASSRCWMRCRSSAITSKRTPSSCACANCCSAFWISFAEFTAVFAVWLTSATLRWANCSVTWATAEAPATLALAAAVERAAALPNSFCASGVALAASRAASSCSNCSTVVVCGVRLKRSDRAERVAARPPPRVAPIVPACTVSPKMVWKSLFGSREYRS